MPTTYTAPVADGTLTDVKSFVRLCARAMPFLSSMREEPLTSSIPERLVPNTVEYDKKILELEDRLFLLEKGEENRLIQMYSDAKQEHETRQRTIQDKVLLVHQRYQTMLVEVHKISWPSELKGLRDFVFEQLTSSLTDDCRLSHVNPFPSRVWHWVDQEVDKVKSDLSFNKTARLDEIARVANCNRYLDLLWETLK